MSDLLGTVDTLIAVRDGLERDIQARRKTQREIGERIDAIRRARGEALSTPPADDVREALAEMFFYAEAPHARWKAGHEGDAAEHLYQNAYGRADDALALVRPRGTVTDAEVEAAWQSLLATASDVTTREDVRAALEAAWGADS